MVETESEIYHTNDKDNMAAMGVKIVFRFMEIFVQLANLCNIVLIHFKDGIHYTQICQIEMVSDTQISTKIALLLVLCFCLKVSSKPLNRKLVLSEVPLNNDYKQLSTCVLLICVCNVFEYYMTYIFCCEERYCEQGLTSTL